MSLFIARGTDGAVDKWLVAEFKNGTRRTGKKNLVSFLGSPIERNNGRTQELRCDPELQISGELLLAQEIPSACRTRGSVSPAAGSVWSAAVAAYVAADGANTCCVHLRSFFYLFIRCASVLAYELCPTE
jgi:hypothetical protein